MQYKYMFIYSTDTIIKDTDFVMVYSRGNPVMVNGNLYYTNNKNAIEDQAVTIFLNKHINDKDLVIIGMYEYKEDNNPSEQLWISVKNMHFLCDPRG